MKFFTIICVLILIAFLCRGWLKEFHFELPGFKWFFKTHDTQQSKTLESKLTLSDRIVESDRVYVDIKNNGGEDIENLTVSIYYENDGAKLRQANRIFHSNEDPLFHR